MPRQPKLIVYQDAAGQWRWRLTAANGKTVADCAEGYSAKAKAVEASCRLSEILDEAFMEVAEKQ